MALTHDAIFADNNDNIPIPIGYTLPTTAIDQTAPDTVSARIYALTASGGVSTTPTLGMDALITAFESWLASTFIPTILGVDIVGNTVTAIARISKIAVGNDPADIYENDATRQFEITFAMTLEVS